jgi:hypothetical protein
MTRQLSLGFESEPWLSTADFYFLIPPFTFLKLQPARPHALKSAPILENETQNYLTGLTATSQYPAEIALRE